LFVVVLKLLLLLSSPHSAAAGIQQVSLDIYYDGGSTNIDQIYKTFSHIFSMRALIFLCAIAVINGCSNIIVSNGASSDGSNIVAYNADSGTLYGSLYHYAAADHSSTDMRQIYDWDSGVYLGEIAEVPHTYNVVGNINEFGLIIGETTYGGISSLQHQSAAKIDYGSLIWVTLQRATTAREAITTLSSLMSEYGYASEGESFSIADSKESW
jgi:hypothetical protein